LFWDTFLNTYLLFFCNWWFLKIYISQGTCSVATQLRCGGISSNRFITNFSGNVLVKIFSKSVNICRPYGQKFASYFFGPPCIFITALIFNVSRCMWPDRSRQALLLLFSQIMLHYKTQALVNALRSSEISHLNIVITVELDVPKWW